jgi:Zn-dependent protease with chaperone function
MPEATLCHVDSKALSILRRLAPWAAAAMVLGGCATSTAPGAVGVTRPQLMIVPSAAVAARAAEGYARMSVEASQAGRLNTDAALTARVRGVGQQLIAVAGSFRPDVAGWPWEINVIQSAELNAFCMPGGKIAVYSGLVERLKLTDAEIAAVMGHEISHALREHSREKISQQTLSEAVVTAIANTGNRNAGAHGALAALGSKLFLQLPFSREMELEADVMGLELMARAGFDPAEAKNVWVKMQQASSSRSVEFFNTHPDNERRISALAEAEGKVRGLYAAGRGGTQVAGDRAVAPAVAPVAVVPTPTAVVTPNALAAATATASPGSVNALVGASVPGRGPESSSAGVATPRPGAGAAGARPLQGKDGYQVERLARHSACRTEASARLTEAGAGYEVYEIECDGKERRIYRCEFGNCVRVGGSE